MDLDINALLGAVFEQNKRSAEIGAQISGNYEQIQSLGESRAVSAVKAGESDALVVEQKGLGELQAQENARRFATSIGSNMDVASEVMSSLGAQYQEAAMGAIAARRQVQNKLDVSFLDSPIEYIVSQITVGDDINRAEAAQAHADEISSSLAKINAATQQTAITQNAIAQTKTAATVQAAADAIKAKAAEQAAQIKQQTLQFNSDGLMKLQQLNAQQLQNLFSAKSAVNAEKQLGLAYEQLAMARKNHENAIADRMERLEDKKKAQAEKDAELAEIGAAVNHGRGLMGLAPITPGKALQLMKIGGEEGEKIKKQYAMGASGVPVISENPGIAAYTVAATGAPLAPAMKPVRDLLVGTLQETYQKKQDGKGMPFDPKDKNALMAATADKIKAAAELQAKVIRTGDSSNIYAAPDFASVAKVVPAVGELPLVKRVLGVHINAGMNELDPQKILSLTTAAIAKGEIRFEDATRDISSLFKAAAATNNATRDYVRVGVRKQDSYNAVLTVKNHNTPDSLAFMTNENVKVNLMDPVAVSHALSQQMAARITRKINWVTPQKDETGTNRLFQETK